MSDHTMKDEADINFNFKPRAQDSKRSLKKEIALSETDDEPPMLAFEKSDVDSFETDSWIDEESNDEIGPTPDFIDEKLHINIVTNPPVVDIDMCSENASTFDEAWIDRKMTQMTDMHGKLERLEDTCQNGSDVLNETISALQMLMSKIDSMPTTCKNTDDKC